MTYREHDKRGGNGTAGVDRSKGTFRNAERPDDLRYVEGNEEGLSEAGEQRENPSKAHRPEVAFEKVKIVFQIAFFEAAKVRPYSCREKVSCSLGYF